MASRKWGHLVTRAKAARSWGVPITVFLGAREDDGRWEPRDTIMAMALQEYEDSIHSCGIPASIAFGEENMERVKWKTSICFACESKESAKNDTKEQFPGQIFYPTWED